MVAMAQGPLPTAVWATSTELQRCQSIISSVRSAVFFHLDQTISRAPGLEPAMSPASLPTITGLLAKVREHVSLPALC